MTRLAVVLAATLLPFATGAQSLRGDGVIRLKPGDFRQLPSAVRRSLERRGCTIPQNPRKTAPHNVIAGSFISSGSRDWAVLCSVRHRSRILVYRNGSASRVDSMALIDDSAFMQDGGNGVVEFSRKIDIATPKNIDEAGKAAGSKPPALNHDGIDDGFIEQASTIRYYYRGKWRTVEDES
jgi:hypothetical protein